MSDDSTAAPPPSPSQGLYRRLTRNMIYLAGGTGAAALFTMLAVALNARALTPKQFGLLILLQTSALIMRGLFSFVTQQPVIHLGAQALADGDKIRLGRVIGYCLVFDMAGAFASALLSLLLIFAAGDLIGLGAEDRFYACIFAASLPLTGYLTANGIFRLLNRFDLLSLIQAASGAAILAACALFYWLGAPFAAYIWVWAAYLALAGQAQLWVAIAMIRRTGVRVDLQSRQLSRADQVAIRRYSFSSWGTAIVEAIRTNGDSLLVGAVLSVEAAGIFNVAKQVAGVLRKATDIYASAAFPEVASLAAQRDLTAARGLRTRMVVAGGIAGLGGLAAMALIGSPLLHYGFGPRFTAGYGALLLLVAAAGLQLVSHTLAVYVQVYISPARLFAAYAAGLLIYLTTTPIAIAGLGITGGALGQVIFSCAIILLCSIFLRPVMRAPQ